MYSTACPQRMVTRTGITAEVLEADQVSALSRQGAGMTSSYTYGGGAQHYSGGAGAYSGGAGAYAMYHESKGKGKKSSRNDFSNVVLPGEGLIGTSNPASSSKPPGATPYTATAMGSSTMPNAANAAGMPSSSSGGNAFGGNPEQQGASV